MGLRGLDVTDSTIESITSECKVLQSLDISHCKKLTEAAGKLISKNCENLLVLKAAHAPNVISDATTNLIANGCKALNHLDISYCRSVTDEGLEGFAKNKHSFKSLLINALSNLSAMGVIGLVRNSSRTLECMEMSFMSPVRAA